MANIDIFQILLYINMQKVLETQNSYIVREL